MANYLNGTYKIKNVYFFENGKILEGTRYSTLEVTFEREDGSTYKLDGQNVVSVLAYEIKKVQSNKVESALNKGQPFFVSRGKEFYENEISYDVYLPVKVIKQYEIFKEYNEGDKSIQNKFEVKLDFKGFVYVYEGISEYLSEEEREKLNISSWSSQLTFIENEIEGDKKMLKELENNTFIEAHKKHLKKCEDQLNAGKKYIWYHYVQKPVDEFAVISGVIRHDKTNERIKFEKLVKDFEKILGIDYLNEDKVRLFLATYNVSKKRARKE